LYIRDTLRLVALTTIIAAVTTSTLAARANEDFASFFRRFVSERTFRISRVPLPLEVTMGNVCGETKDDSKWSRREYMKEFTPPLSSEQLTSRGLSESVTQVSLTEVAVFQYRDEADSYLLTYTFRRIRGHWVLTHFEDMSC
jgi:uncharacterized protein DUF4348